MRKLVVSVVAAVVVTFAVMLYRTATFFAESQPQPTEWQDPVGLDDEAAVRRFARALTFATLSHDDRSNFDAEAFRALHAYLQNAFPLVHEQATRTEVNGYSLVFHLAGRDPSLPPVLFLSHMDVVPVEENTRDEWTHPPFGGVVADGYVWGRGALDDKIGVVALLEAMERRLAEGWRPQRSIYLAFGHDEEVGGMEGAQRVAEYFAQQGVRFDFVLDEGGALTQGLLQDIGQPLAVIGISEKGYVNLVLTVNAAGGHSSQPPAQTALGILARAIVKVEDNPFPARLDNLMPTLEAVGFAMPFSKRLAMSNLWLLSPLVERSLLADKDAAAGIRTTTAATMASGSPKSNILPTRATAVINFRILPGETVDSVRQRVVDLIDDERVGVRAEYGIDPSPVSSTDSRGYRIVAGSIRAMAPDALVAPYMVRGGTDARYFHDLSPNVYRFLAVRIDPETMRQVHGIDEHVAIDDYLAAIRYYYNVMGQAGEP